MGASSAIDFFTMPIHFLDRNYTETLKEDREAFILADQLGYTEAFVGEHITDLAETITSSAMFICSLVHATKQIKLGTGGNGAVVGEPDRMTSVSVVTLP